MASKALTTQSFFSNSSSSSLVISITKVLQSTNPYFIYPHSTKTPQNISNLSRFSPNLNPNLVIQVIKNQTNPYHALLFFNWASMPSPNPTNYFHTFSCYTAIIDVLLSHRLYTTAIQLLEAHKKLCDIMISKLIRAFGNESDIRAAIDWFHRAKLVGKNGNCLASFNSLLVVLIRANRIKLASAIFDQAVKEGVIRPDVIAYTTMIKGYCKVRKVKDAQKLFDEMPCRPNKATYGIMLHGLCKKGMMVEARHFVDKMIMSKDCLPDVVTYSMLIDGYCKKGEMEAAMMCFDEMVSQGFESNLITYNTIVNGFCLIGKVDEAKKMMTKMRLDGVKDNVITHTSLLRGYCAAGRVDDAVKHLEDMICLGMDPDVQAYGLLLNEFCKLGKVAEAISLIRDMIERRVYPSISSFNAVLKVLVERGELDEAVLFLKWMPDISCPPNFLSYYTVISSLSKTGRRVQQVEELVKSMIQDGHILDHSIYSCLTKMYSECGEHEKASQVFYDALKDGIVIHLDSFAVLLEALCAKGSISDAEEHAQKLLEKCPVTQLENYQRVLNELKSKYADQKS